MRTRRYAFWGGLVVAAAVLIRTVAVAAAPVIYGYRDSNRDWTSQAREGTALYVEGVGFGAVVGTVTFNGVVAPLVTWKDGEVEVMVPHMGTANVAAAVVVTLSGGLAVPSGYNLTVLPLVLPAPSPSLPPPPLPPAVGVSPPAVVVAPLVSLVSTLDWGTVAVSALPNNRAALLTNAGGQALTGTVTAFSDPDFTLLWPAGTKAGDVVPFTLATWQNLPLVVQFRPHTVGTRSLSFTVTTNAGVQTVTLKAAVQ